MITIRVQQGSGGNISHLSRPRETIGTGKRADWTVRDPRVAGIHAAFFVKDDRLWVEDVSGTEMGTLVNGDRIDAPRMLLATDTVGIGTAAVTFSGFLPDGRVPAGSFYDWPLAKGEELELETQRNFAIELLTPDAAQALAYAWCDRAARVRLASAVEAAMSVDKGSKLRRSPRVADRETAIAMHAQLRRLAVDAQRDLQSASDAKRPAEEIEALERLLYALRAGRDAMRACGAPYSGKPGFAAMIGYDENTEPPPDDAQHREAHAIPRTGVTAGHCADTARILEHDDGIAEVRQQVKEVADAEKA